MDKKDKKLKKQKKQCIFIKNKEKNA